MSDESVCLRCAKSDKKGCCWIDPKHEEQAFGISIFDVQRIVKATGKKPSEFLSAEKVSPELRKSVASGQDDLYAVMRGNFRLRLAAQDSGYCKLLGPQGCTLKAEDRPRVCALYPAHYNVVGERIILKSDALADETGCLALAECGGSEHKLYRLVNTTEKANQKLAQLAHDEAEDHAAIGRAELEMMLDEMECS